MSRCARTSHALVLVVCLFSLPGRTGATTPGQSVTAPSRALESLLQRARETRSHALYASKGGDLLLDWAANDDPRPVELMSALKSLVAVAVGRLLQLGYLESIDAPVHELYPEWRKGRKAAITVRQLMNHTSGLQNVANARIVKGTEVTLTLQNGARSDLMSRQVPAGSG